MSFQAVYNYDIARRVPFHGEISFEELAGACNLNVVDLRRILRFAMTFHHIFQEPRTGMVKHSAASRKLAEDPLARAALGYTVNEVWPSFAHVSTFITSCFSQD